MTGRVLRNTRPTRLVHAAVYLTTFGAGLTGIALWGEDGVRAVAQMFGGHAGSSRLHRWLGYAVAAAPAAALLLKPRAVGRFFREASRIDPGDMMWWRRFPGFLLTPARRPPAPHRGHFDPGQRLMAWALVASLALLFLSGLAMVFAVDLLGGAFGLVSRIHTWSAVALALLVAGHVGIGVGILKGYRGVWRAMHSGGRGEVPEELARSLWPVWAGGRLINRDSP